MADAAVANKVDALSWCGFEPGSKVPVAQAVTPIVTLGLVSGKVIACVRKTGARLTTMPR